MRLMNGATIDGAIVEVSLSKPIDKSALTRLIRATPSPTSHLLTNAAAIMAAVSAGNPSLVAPQPSVITIPFSTNPLDASAVSQTVSASGNTPPAISLAPTQFQSFQTTQSLLTTVPNSQNPSRFGI